MHFSKNLKQTHPSIYLGQGSVASKDTGTTVPVPRLLTCQKQGRRNRTCTNEKGFLFVLVASFKEDSGQKWVGPRQSPGQKGLPALTPSDSPEGTVLWPLELIPAEHIQQPPALQNHCSTFEIAHWLWYTTYRWSLIQLYWKPIFFSLSSRIFTVPSPQDSLKYKNI